MKLTTVARLVVALGAVWVAAIVFAPIGLASANGGAQLCALGTYAVGSFVCHQIPARSFYLDGHPLAVCGRCTGLYVSALAGGLLALLAWREVPAPGSRNRRGVFSDDRWLLTVAALPTALSWGLEHVGLAAQSNVIRAVAALPLGFAGAWVVIRMLATDGVQRSAGGGQAKAGSHRAAS